ncbi:hypothetical protein [Sorangium sp. So ce131]|uniref:hypothetical protein n=1 Tax=Sorangium sp. So ce131 TaxID=3133282 RepID=UPI003F626115
MISGELFAVARSSAFVNVHNCGVNRKWPGGELTGAVPLDPIHLDAGQPAGLRRFGGCNNPVWWDRGFVETYTRVEREV